MSISKIILRSSFSRSIESLVAIAVGFFMLPYMLNNLGQEVYGLWVLVSSIVASFHIFDLGFANSITVFLSKSFSKKNFSAVNKTISTALIIYSFLACIILLVSAFVAISVPYWLETEDLTRLTQSLILIVGSNLALEFPFKAFAGVAVSYYRFDLVSYSQLTFRLITVLVTIVLIENGMSLYYIAWGYFCVGRFSNLVFFLIARHLYREMQLSFSLVNRDTVRELLNFSLWTFIIDASRIVRSRADILIVGIFLSTTTLATYYVSVRLADIALQLLTQATNFSLPIFSHYKAKENLQQLRRGVILFSRLNAMVGAMLLVGLTLLGLSFIKLWIGPGHDADLSYQCMIILLIGRLSFFQAIPASTSLYVSGGHRYLAIVGLFETGLAISLTYWLVQYTSLGLIGAAIGMGIGNLITRSILLTWKACGNIDYSLTRLYQHLAPIVILAIVVLAFGLMLPEIYRSPKTYAGLLARSAVLGTLILGGLVFILSREERRIIVGLLPEGVVKCFGGPTSPPN